MLLMLDKLPALGRLDFFEPALAIMAGYGLTSFLIAQSLNQIEKAYGPNNSIVDNCHVRVCFATNDERTARSVSDALGMATELHAMKSYAGHRLSPWLGYLMVSRQETARPLLTPGELMQLAPDDGLVLVSGCPPIRAKKARYFEDPKFRERVLRPAPSGNGERRAQPPDDDWSGLPLPVVPAAKPNARMQVKARARIDDPANSGIRRQPELPEHEDVASEHKPQKPEFYFGDREGDDEVQRARVLRAQAAANIPRQGAMDPGDGLGL